MYYETIFENGDHSVAFYENDDEEALTAIESHHKRALAGERALASEPQSPAAVRIVKVLKYESHPQDYTESQTLPVEVLRKKLDEAFNDLAVGDLISVPQMTQALRDTTSPMVDSAPHDSNYVAPEDSELEATWL